MKSELPGILTLWKPATVTVEAWGATVARFGRISIARRRDAGTGEVSGHAVWGTFVAATPMALCWQWACGAANAVVLLNPMAVFSNVSLCNDGGVPLSANQTLLELNRSLYSLEWQEEVAAEVARSAYGNARNLRHGRTARTARTNSQRLAA
jgi:hypothetical protein